ncbi:MAG: hypothetical protein V3V28_09120 [Polaribacter sp.]|uniref:hypothetical protein n=1 Tax=Polaribacter sp. TaxID=1920175 RepID=UPI002F3568B2
MGFILFFAIIIIVLVVLAFNYENEKAERKYDFEKKLNDLKVKNKGIDKVHTKYFDYSRKGQKLEKEKKIEDAIIAYEKGLEFAYSEPILKIHNYAHSIHRLIILYGKTKQKEKLKQHLQNSIEKHPNFKNAEDWKKRLNKLN